MFHPLDRPMERGWVGRIDGDRVVHLAAQTLQSFFTGGSAAREHADYRLDEVRLLAPVLHPPSVRDFDAFERHEQPAFYFSNPASIFGPDAAVPYPEGTEELDYELEVAAVIGADGGIAGFTAMNDWSARDLQRVEVKDGLGPAKGKDFATSIGPVVVSVDEFPGVEAEMVARVNGEERSRGNLRELCFSWEQLRAHAARNTTLRPGELLGSGGVGGGEPGGSWLQLGDVVELEVEGIGILRNTVA
jgi:fumarylacetoacetate (FAA) hydrolase